MGRAKSERGRGKDKNFSFFFLFIFFKLTQMDSNKFEFNQTKRMHRYECNINVSKTLYMLLIYKKIIFPYIIYEHLVIKIILFTIFKKCYFRVLHPCSGPCGP